MVGNFKAFTLNYHRKVNVLMSKVSVGVAFDPRHSPDGPPLVEFDAIWDTGASASMISQSVVQKCSLQPTGQINVQTANGQMICNTYLICIKLPNEVGFQAVRVTEGKLHGTDMLIGMDLIGEGDFAISNFQGATVLTYRYPSVAKTDFTEKTKQLNTPPNPKIGRNSPCPCGSGLKYKKCHGKN